MFPPRAERAEDSLGPPPCGGAPEGAAAEKATLRLSLPPPARAEDIARACVRLCAEIGAPATVAPTWSAVGDDHGRFAAEEGVAVELHGSSHALICQRLWPAFCREFPQLECLHVQVAGRGFNGCIYDYLRPSACPAALRARERRRESAAPEVPTEKMPPPVPESGTPPPCPA